jgi:hypothetical protein
VKPATESNSPDSIGQNVTFRHGTFGAQARLMIVILLCVIWAIGSLAVSEPSHRVFLTILCGLTVLLYSYLAYIKLEISESGFSHRNLLGNRIFEFARIEEAFFETTSVGEGHYASVFSVRLKEGTEKKKIPISIFPVRATALLLTALERHGTRSAKTGVGWFNASYKKSANCNHRS